MDYGVVFRLDTTGKETVLHSFTDGSDGASPTAGLIRDSAGNLYGTAESGAPGLVGVVFELDTTGSFTVLYTLGDQGGINPFAGLSQGSAGNLYGTAFRDGASGYGVVFKLQP
jgi:uncharacterized repeat protein (TIGR03803 family)